MVIEISVVLLRDDLCGHVVSFPENIYTRDIHLSRCFGMVCRPICTLVVSGFVALNDGNKYVIFCLNIGRSNILT